jgi:hypothetical protein
MEGTSGHADTGGMRWWMSAERKARGRRRKKTVAMVLSWNVG